MLFISLSGQYRTRTTDFQCNLLSSDASGIYASGIYHINDGVVFQVDITAIGFLSFVDTASVICPCFYWKTFIAHRSFQ